MRRVLVGLFFASFALTLLAGCGSAPSTQLAPDVKEPDNRNVSGEEILRRKQAADAGNPSGSATNVSNTAPR